MTSNNAEETGASLQEENPAKTQKLEEENDNQVQTPDAVICGVCCKDVKEKFISCSKCHFHIHYRCTLLPSYQLYYFVEKTRKYTCVNCTPEGTVDLSSDGVDVLINDIKDHLIDVENINRRLQEENIHLRGENIQVKNNIKVEKKNNANNIKELDTKLKKLQTKLSESNRISAEKTKEIKRLQNEKSKETGMHRGTPNVLNVSIDEEMNIIRNDEKEDPFIDEYIEFKKFVTLEIQKMNQKIANLEKDKNNLRMKNSNQQLYKEQNTTFKEQNKNETNYNSFQSTNRFQPIYTEPLLRQEDNFDNTDYNTEIKHFPIPNNRRPSPVINQHPERDLLPNKIYRTNASQQVIPGNTNYNNAVKYGKKTYVLGTSMIRGIPRKVFNSKLKKCSARFRPFIGATLKQMETYVQPILNDDTPDVLVLQIGCNDIGNMNLTDKEIAEWIVKIGRQCRERNVNYVFISSVICRTQNRLNRKVQAVNNILQQICKLNGLGFINNSNIVLEHICEDGLHLNDNGKALLANNFVHVLNNFIL